MEAMMGPFQHQLLERIIASRPDFPAETRDMLERAGAGRRAGAAAIAIKFVLHGLVTGAIFGMLGGLLGVAVFKKDAPPTAPASPERVEVLPPE